MTTQEFREEFKRLLDLFTINSEQVLFLLDKASGHDNLRILTEHEVKLLHNAEYEYSMSQQYEEVNRLQEEQDEMDYRQHQEFLRRTKLMEEYEIPHNPDMLYVSDEEFNKFIEENILPSNSYKLVSSQPEEDLPW
jgi:hypothetical protein